MRLLVNTNFIVCTMYEWELFESHISEIRVKQIRVNQGFGEATDHALLR